MDAPSAADKHIKHLQILNLNTQRIPSRRVSRKMYGQRDTPSKQGPSMYSQQQPRSAPHSGHQAHWQSKPGLHNATGDMSPDLWQALCDTVRSFSGSSNVSPTREQWALFLYFLSQSTQHQAQPQPRQKVARRLPSDFWSSQNDADKDNDDDIEVEDITPTSTPDNILIRRPDFRISASSNPNTSSLTELPDSRNTPYQPNMANTNGNNDQTGPQHANNQGGPFQVDYTEYYRMMTQHPSYKAGNFYGPIRTSSDGTILMGNSESASERSHFYAGAEITGSGGVIMGDVSPQLAAAISGSNAALQTERRLSPNNATVVDGAQRLGQAADGPAELVTARPAVSATPAQVTQQSWANRR